MLLQVLHFDLVCSRVVLLTLEADIGQPFYTAPVFLECVGMFDTAADTAPPLDHVYIKMRRSVCRKPYITVAKEVKVALPTVRKQSGGIACFVETLCRKVHFAVLA